MVSDGQMETQKDLKYFKAFFALNPKQIRRSVVISPIIYPKRFGAQKVNKSILGYLVANFKRFTFVKTPMTQSAVCDLVFLLKKTPCQEIIFIGAIGGLQKGMKIGDVVCSQEAKDIYSVNSIHEETRKKLLALRKKWVMGIDFESRAFFAAAKRAKISAYACYVVTDLPLSKPFYLPKSEKERGRIQKAMERIINGCVNEKT